MQPEAAHRSGRDEGAAGLARHVRSVALVSSDSFCIVNFRSEFIVELVQAGIRVYALARHDPEGRRRIERLGAVPVDIELDPAGMNPWAKMGAWRMGNVRDFDYDVNALVRSPRARAIYSRIREDKCHCDHNIDQSLSLLTDGGFRNRVLKNAARKLVA